MNALPHSTALVAQQAPRSNGRLESWVLTLSLAGYPVIAGISQLTGIDNRPLSIAMRGVLLAICLIVLLKSPFTRLSGKNVVFWVGWWLFWSAYLLRLSFDTVFFPVELPLAYSEYWIFAVGTCLIPALAVSRGNIGLTNDRAFKKTYWMLVAGAVLNLLALLGQIATGDIETLRAETDVLNPIALGHIGVSILLLSVWRLNEKGAEDRRGRLATYICCGIAVFTIFISASKGPVLSLLAGLAVYAMSRPGRFFSRYLSAALLLVPLVIAVNFDAIQNSFLVARIADGIFSDATRLHLLNDAAQLIRRSPFIGAGIEPLDTYPHNLIVESFLSFGLVTGIPFCLLLLAAVVRIVSLAPCGKAFWVVLLFVQYGLAGMFSGSLYGSYIFWVLLVLVISQPIHSANILTKSLKNPSP